MHADNQIQSMLTAIEEEIHRVIDLVDRPGEAITHGAGLSRTDGFGMGDYRSMLAYHLGWEGEGAGIEARGKRIRPLLVLLCCASAGGDWRQALPAAAGVELVHNFSLIHDDIQDNSPTRRGRETVWKLWGVPQAINAGDAMLVLAHLGILRLDQLISSGFSYQLPIKADRILQQACLALTKGQYLDLAYEAHQRLPLEKYWEMVGGKTAALLAASTELGALVAEVPDSCREKYRVFGYYLGLAFQAQDDILGIWGNAAQTGKSAASDLLAGKKSLPVVYALDQNGPFARRWEQGPIQPIEIDSLARQLEAEGARAYAQESAVIMTDKALEALEGAEPQGPAGEVLIGLAKHLLKRGG